ncbi:unnamed protein product [Ixodes persulcatus]
MQRQRPLSESLFQTRMATVKYIFGEWPLPWHGANIEDTLKRWIFRLIQVPPSFDRYPGDSIKFLRSFAISGPFAHRGSRTRKRTHSIGLLWMPATRRFARALLLV